MRRKVFHLCREDEDRGGRLLVVGGIGRQAEIGVVNVDMTVKGLCQPGGIEEDVLVAIAVVVDAADDSFGADIVFPFRLCMQLCRQRPQVFVAS